MITKPQDLLVCLKILVLGHLPPYAELGKSLGMSASGTHDAVKRARRAGLLDPITLQANRSALEEFMIHGVRYAFPTEQGPRTRGIPTSHAAAPLNKELAFDEQDVPVWPHPEGPMRGYELRPLCRSAADAALKDPQLYEWLALLDALRAGKARERELAAQHVRRKMKEHHAAGIH